MNLFIIFLILIVVVALLLIAIIMVQNPKGGGLDSTFAGSGGGMIGGVKQTTDFLDKATWTLFALMVGLILLSNTIVFKSTQDVKEEIAVPQTIEVPSKNTQNTLPLPSNQSEENQGEAE